MGHAALDAVQLLAGMAKAGRHSQEVAATAEGIAAGWLLDAAGCAAPKWLALLVQELRRWCVIASSHSPFAGTGCIARAAPSRPRKPGAGRRRWIRRTGCCDFTSSFAPMCSADSAPSAR